MVISERAMTRLIMKHVTLREVWSGDGYNRKYETQIDVKGLAQALVKRFEKEATK